MTGMIVIVSLLVVMTAATAGFVMASARRTETQVHASGVETPVYDEPAEVPAFSDYHVIENYRLPTLTISVLSNADRGAAACSDLYPASHVAPNGDVRKWLETNRNSGAWLQGKKREKVPPREFVQLLRRFKDQVVLIDVAEPAKFSEGHLPGAINIPLGELPNRFSDIPKNRPVIFYCRIGQRSPRACYRAQEKGGFNPKDTYFLDACVRFPEQGSAELIEAFA